MGNLVQFRKFDGPSWVPGIVMEKTGPISYKIKVHCKTLKKHLDHLRVRKSLPEQAPLSAMEMATASASPQLEANSMLTPPDSERMDSVI